MFKDKVKKLRTDLGITQKKAAEEIGISQCYYCEIENGKHQNLAMLERIANHYNIPFAVFFLSDNQFNTFLNDNKITIVRNV